MDFIRYYLLSSTIYIQSSVGSKNQESNLFLSFVFTSTGALNNASTTLCSASAFSATLQLFIYSALKQSQIPRNLKKSASQSISPSTNFFLSLSTHFASNLQDAAQWATCPPALVTASITASSAFNEVSNIFDFISSYFDGICKGGLQRAL